MKFSETWLREWVNPAINTSDLSEQITLAGLEVDDISAVSGDFAGVVVGKVVSCQQHPNADKLRITQVDVGKEVLLNIVCGAPNCREGLFVACAVIGAQLPGNFKIKATKLRGELSEGMLCSYAELGIDDNNQGIIELPLDAPIGMDLRNYLQLNDHTIEISITPNRGDCLSIRGIARDVAALNQLTINEPIWTPVNTTISDQLSITVESPQDCPRYLGRIIRGLNRKASTPLWIKEKLRRCGVRSIDVIVDITNYVLIELGQPMHAFDLTKINEGIIVRKAKKDERLVLLDGQDVNLLPDTLVIADHCKPIAMAGIFGGLASGVTESTTDILLESAFFSQHAIAGHARKYGLHTDASHRYERGIDPDLQLKAMERASQLLLSICGGEAGPVIDVTHTDCLPKINKITLRRSKLNGLLGHHIASEFVTSTLKNLGCKVIEEADNWQVTIPSWRFDLILEENLVQEIARIYGYNNIPNTPIISYLEMPKRPEAQLSLHKLKALLVTKGYQEAITYSFVDPKLQNLIHPNTDGLKLQNPISADMSVMRLSLWTGLLAALKYNQNRQQTRIRLFECGLRFIPDIHSALQIRQEFVISGVVSGARYEEQWGIESKLVDFYDLKGDLESLFKLTGNFDDVQFRNANHPALHPGQSAEVYLNNQRVGLIGVLHPELEHKLDLCGRTVIFELEWDKISECKIPQAHEISKFPANRRDIAVVVKEDIPVEEILLTCKNVGANHVVGVNLFDVYRGKGIKSGYKSLAISLLLQDISRTLEEDEIAATVAQCVAVLKDRFQASLRD